MKTYQQIFAELRDQKRAALIPFFVIGDPDYDTSLAIVKAAVDAGADVLELGIPFSDPIADGPTIQKADIRAIGSGMTVHKALEFIRDLRASRPAHREIPVGLLMYYNLIHQYGIEKFFRDVHEAGVNSVLVADLSIDDAEEVAAPAAAAGLDTVFMVTPNTEPARMRQIASKTTGFIYTVSLLGVTGSRDALSAEVATLIRRLKNATDVPVCVGFGVSTPEHAKTIADAGAEGVIIGSRLVAMIENNLRDSGKAIAEITGLLRETRARLSG
ncbi:MAG: tryptophan synthase subunit alpha [Planctomycetes bacterium RBG_13_62_9]|nr:MAG: tryptophan synthase subunit alpha [Planctomycetes bacterium RBG_13_62_9]